MQLNGGLASGFEYATLCLFMRFHKVNSAALRPIFSIEGITENQWSALMALLEKRVETAADLERDLVYDKGAMTRLVDYLESRGWVHRSRVSGDRRRINLILTPEGAALALRCRSQILTLYRRALSDWPQDEIGKLIRSMSKLCDTL